jgi:cobalt/nickel transport system permease protein
MIQILFFAFFLIFLSLRNVEYIAFVIGILFVLANKDVFKISVKVVKSIFFFNIAVSIGYILMKNDWVDYVVYINLKVFMLTFYVFWFFEKIDIVRFFSFNKDLSYLLTITLSQIYSYKKTYVDFRDAFRARVVNLRDKEKDFIFNTFNFFLKKAMRDAKERSLAMKARGFFDE